ncbi:phage head morphogenesis protein [Fusobacterium ulcerans]|jgi:SPP1 gp7 family putative phage head morphogenesis protein|uniref:phage head morphogenesis protein n=1 Tax=Fusobacterium ulcerans TaxID=861 RepID=UPI0027B8B054|nr:minor capsid protein [Fusobacterium ulcerans]
MKERFPIEVELAYSKTLNKLIDDIEEKFREIFIREKKSSSPKRKSNSLIDMEQVTREYIEDRERKQVIRLNKKETEEEKEFLKYFEELITTEYAANLCIDYLLEALQYTIDGINAEITTIKGVDFFSQAFVDESIIKKILEENISLIKAEPLKYLRSYDKAVAKLVKEKVEEGLTLKDLSEAIMQTTGVEKARADLIAADQIGNVFAEASKRQFKGIGLKKFKWITAGDKRVRPSHMERDGKIYNWEEPPDGEIPGSAIRCRCIASVVENEVLMLAA